MKHIETNIFEIENLSELNCNYRTYRVKGISPDLDDYDKNIQFLVDRLSRRYKSPCITYRIGNDTFIAQPEGFKRLPESFDVVRATVKIEEEDGLKDLKFDQLNETTSQLAVRFLQFSIQGLLFDSPHLWQPQSGHPFYSKTPDRDFRIKSQDTDMYKGFILRVVHLSNGKIGLCVDTSCKYVSRNYLPTDIDRDSFNRHYKGQRCVYEWGDNWYEFKIEGLNDLDVSEVMLPGNETLYENIQKLGGGRNQNILSLPKDCSVIAYRNSWNQQRNVPSGLCKLTLSTDHQYVNRFHKKSMKPPFERRKEIKFVVDRYLRNLTFGHTQIKLSENPISSEENRFDIPDLKFGNNTILSVNNTENSISVPVSHFGTKKRELLYSNEAGIYKKEIFSPQYFILPKSVYDSFGLKFIEDIRREVGNLYSNKDEIEYNPTIIKYDDSVQKSIYNIGREIIKSVEENDIRSGYGVVMIPRIKSSLIRNEDELANLVRRELRERNVYVSVIHDEIPKESYELVDISKTEKDWQICSDYSRRGRYKGYLKNVVLNKILLLNSHWPFVLSSKLNADLTIGIDVKNNTSGFTAVYKDGSNIRFFSSESEDKEKLNKDHIQRKIEEIIEQEQSILSLEIKDIVIHRQGKLFPPEIKGINNALSKLSKMGVISDNYNCTFIEIKKTARLPLRLFKIVDDHSDQRELIYNPNVGTYFLLSRNDGFVCTTGYPFRHQGTTRPLHVIKKKGKLPFNKILEDVFYLANLTWTKIDDCSRDPLTIKMGDIRLREIAGEYNEDALKFEKDGGEEFE